MDVIETAIKCHSLDLATWAMCLMALLKLSSRFPSCSQYVFIDFLFLQVANVDKLLSHGAYLYFAGRALVKWAISNLNVSNIPCICFASLRIVLSSTSNVSFFIPLNFFSVVGIM